jgi:hypothetical protein
MGRGGYDRQVFLDFEAKALKEAQFLEKLPLKTKHSFFGWHTGRILTLPPSQREGKTKPSEQRAGAQTSKKPLTPALSPSEGEREDLLLES